jgi:hypothetical protein
MDKVHKTIITQRTDVSVLDLSSLKEKRLGGILRINHRLMTTQRR